MVTANQALRALDFGQPDSESEPDLDRRFVRTEDFTRFLDPRNMLILGPKGSGKSALFEMFAKHLPSTRKLAGDGLSGVLIATGTGFGDSKELTATDIQSFRQLGEFQYEAVWKLYIALKLAMHLGSQRFTSDGPLREVLRATKKVPDYRIGPMMSSVWQLVVGAAPEEVEVNIMGSGARIKSGRATLDVLTSCRIFRRCWSATISASGCCLTRSMKFIQAILHSVIAPSKAFSQLAWRSNASTPT